MNKIGGAGATITVPAPRNLPDAGVVGEVGHMLNKNGLGRFAHAIVNDQRCPRIANLMSLEGSEWTDLANDVGMKAGDKGTFRDMLREGKRLLDDLSKLNAPWDPARFEGLKKIVSKAEQLGFLPPELTQARRVAIDLQETLDGLIHGMSSRSIDQLKSCITKGDQLGFCTPELAGAKSMLCQLEAALSGLVHAIKSTDMQQIQNWIRKCDQLAFSPSDLRKAQALLTASENS